MLFRDMRVSYATERIVSDNFLMCCLEEINFRLHVNIHNLIPAMTKSTFPDSSVFLSFQFDLFEESWSYLPNVTVVPQTQFSNCLPDFGQYPYFFAVLDTVESEHFCIVVFHLICHVVSRKRQYSLINWTCMHRHISPITVPAIIYFYFNLYSS